MGWGLQTAGLKAAERWILMRGGREETEHEVPMARLTILNVEVRCHTRTSLLTNPILSFSLSPSLSLSLSLFLSFSLSLHVGAWVCGWYGPYYHSLCHTSQISQYIYTYHLIYILLILRPESRDDPASWVERDWCFVSSQSCLITLITPKWPFSDAGRVAVVTVCLTRARCEYITLIALTTSITLIIWK